MRNWLLQEEEKNKVGRPKLANDGEVKKAKFTVALSLLIVAVLFFVFLCMMKGVSPTDEFYSLTLAKVLGQKENKNGFLVREYYNKDNNYVMEVKVPDIIDNYSGSYKYTTYYLKDDNWVTKETKDIKAGAKSFKIIYKSKKNKNVTWKVKLQIVNANKITKSYAPAGFTYSDSEKQDELYAYKVFTVKGYYSPVTLEEIKEANKNENKINIKTIKSDPRTFIFDGKDNTYKLNVKYTDASGKETIIINQDNLNSKTNFTIPNINRSAKVIVKAWIKGSNSNTTLKSISLSNWKVEDDSEGNYYITNTYILKPENNYEIRD